MSGFGIYARKNLLDRHVEPQTYETLMILKIAHSRIVDPSLKKQVPHKLVPTRIPSRRTIRQTQKHTVQRQAVELDPRKHITVRVIQREHQRQLQNLLIRHKRRNVVQRRKTTASAIKRVSRWLGLVTKLHRNAIISQMPQPVANTEKYAIVLVA